MSTSCLVKASTLAWAWHLFGAELSMVDLSTFHTCPCWIVSTPPFKLHLGSYWNCIQSPRACIHCWSVTNICSGFVKQKAPGHRMLNALLKWANGFKKCWAKLLPSVSRLAANKLSVQLNPRIFTTFYRFCAFRGCLKAVPDRWILWGKKSFEG